MPDHPTLAKNSKQYYTWLREHQWQITVKQLKICDAITAALFVKRNQSKTCKTRKTRKEKQT